MKTDEAEHILARTGNQLLLGSIIADLGALTAGAAYRSQDLLDALGNRKLSAAFACAAWDIAMRSERQGVTIRAEMSVEEEDVSLLGIVPYARMSGSWRNESHELRAAVEVLKSMEPPALQKALGRLVDVAGGLLVMNENEFGEMAGEGPGILARATKLVAPQAGAIRFSAIVMLIGRPEEMWVAQFQAARQGGPMPAEGENPFRLTLSLEDNPDHVPLPNPSGACEKETPVP